MALLTLSLWVSVVQVFCVIPKYIQPFLRKTLGTREWPPKLLCSRQSPQVLLGPREKMGWGQGRCPGK